MKLPSAAMNCIELDPDKKKKENKNSFFGSFMAWKGVKRCVIVENIASC